MIDSVNSFYSYAVVTKIDVIDETTTDFPTVSFCLPVHFLEIFRGNTNNLLSYYQSIPDLASFMLECTFNLMPCSPIDFDVNYDAISKACYTFNSGKNFSNQTVPVKNTSNTDIDTGLKVTLRVEKFMLNKKLQPNPYKMLVYILNVSQMFKGGNLYASDYGQQYADVYTLLKVNREFVHKLPSPYNDCIKV